jgi:hypothetical protein
VVNAEQYFVRVGRALGAARTPGEGGVKGKRPAARLHGLHELHECLLLTVAIITCRWQDPLSVDEQ